jgi:hypothetical protein
MGIFNLVDEFTALSTKDESLNDKIVKTHKENVHFQSIT